MSSLSVLDGLLSLGAVELALFSISSESSDAAGALLGLLSKGCCDSVSCGLFANANEGKKDNDMQNTRIVLKEMRK